MRVHLTAHSTPSTMILAISPPVFSDHGGGLDLVCKAINNNPVMHNKTLTTYSAINPNGHLCPYSLLTL